MKIDTTNMCSHLQRKLFAPDGEYSAIRKQIECDPMLIAVVRLRHSRFYERRDSSAFQSRYSDGKCLAAEWLEQKR